MFVEGTESSCDCNPSCMYPSAWKFMIVGVPPQEKEELEMQVLRRSFFDPGFGVEFSKQPIFQVV